MSGRHTPGSAPPTGDERALLERDTVEMRRTEVLASLGIEASTETEIDDTASGAHDVVEDAEAGPTVVEAPRAHVDFDVPRLEAVPDFGERYTPQKILGQGGMGVVRIHHDRQTGRHVAIKTMRTDVADASAHERFVQEARIQAQLEHPSVVPVYDLALDDRGQPFFSMRRVRGLTLEQVIDRLQSGAPLAFREAHSPRRLVSAFSRLCLAVHYAHEHGVLHRDLKPANVLLGEFGEVYLIDWGLARLSSPGVAARTLRVARPERETMSGSVLGTAGYISPEQAEGKVRELTPASEVYALGATLFELLTLTPLHPSPNAMFRLESTLRCSTRHRCPSRRAPEQNIDSDLDAIVLRATERAAVDRYPSARALHEALEAYLDGRRNAESRALHAEQLASMATAAAQAATGELGAQEQRSALRDAIGALALDPQNRSAIAAFIDLATHVPTALPDRVRDTIQARGRARMRWLGAVMAFAYASTFVCLPVFAAVGVRHWAPIIVTYSALLVAALLGVSIARSSGSTDKLAIASMLISNAGLMATASFLGPLLLTPSLIAINTASYAIYCGRAARIASLACGLLCVTVGAAISALASADSYRVEEGVLSVASSAFDLAPTPVYVLLLGMGLIQVLATALIAMRLRADLDRAEQATSMQTWMLRGLVARTDDAPKPRPVD